MDYDAGNSEAVEQRENERKLANDQSMKDMREVLATDEGRRVMWKLLSHTRPLSMSYVPGGLTEDMYYNEGRKSVGRFLILELTNADPLAYINLQRENIECQNQ